MFLNLNDQKPDLYSASRLLVTECYKLTKVRRAALSVHINIAEGSSRKSEVERKRYYEISRGSIIEIDAAFDIARDLNYLGDIKLETLGEQMIRCFKMLTAMINATMKT